MQKVSQIFKKMFLKILKGKKYILIIPLERTYDRRNYLLYLRLMVS